MIIIAVETKDQELTTYRFDKTSIIIGRSADCDVAIDVPGISRQHARVHLEGETLLADDMGSTNGTWLGTEKISSAELASGDLLRIGDALITVSLDRVDAQTGEANRSTAVTSGEQSEAAADVESDYLTEGEKARDLAPGPGAGDFYWQSLASFLAPVWDFINDESVTEIMINGHDDIYIERTGQLFHTDARFTKDQLNAAVLNIAQFVGRRISEQEPYLDARLPDGSRVAVLSPPCSRKGISVAIRKFAKEKLTVEKLLEFSSFSPEMLTFLRACVTLRKNVIISGGTSSGKTSLLNVVSGLIPPDERIITIEDSAELQLAQDHVVAMESKPPDKKGRGEMTIRDLLKASLRMRPDRIIVGEIRGGEALDLLQAMNTGHSGSMTTVHASSPPQALTRLETLALFSGIEIPVRALREQVSSAIELIIQSARLPDRSRKITHISEVRPLNEDGSYSVEDIFRFNHTGTKNGRIEGEHAMTGRKPQILDEMKIAGLAEAVALFEG